MLERVHGIAVLSENAGVIHVEKRIGAGLHFAENAAVPLEMIGAGAAAGYEFAREASALQGAQGRFHCVDDTRRHSATLAIVRLVLG